MIKLVEKGILGQCILNQCEARTQWKFQTTGKISRIGWKNLGFLLWIHFLKQRLLNNEDRYNQHPSNEEEFDCASNRGKDGGSKATADNFHRCCGC